jgi:hypothetical protein
MSSNGQKTKIDDVIKQSFHTAQKIDNFRKKSTFSHSLITASDELVVISEALL